MIRRTCLVVLAGFLLNLVSCKPDPDLILIDSGIGEIQTFLKQTETVVLSPNLSTNEDVNFTWKINGETISTDPSLLFHQSETGHYNIVFIATLGSQSATCSYSIWVFPPFRKETAKSNAYIDSLISYNPAPGQFINTSVGIPEAALTVVGTKDGGLVTLGAFGGYLIARFDHTVLNLDEADLLIFANAHSGSSEPGIVQVSYDENQNGVADDVWYELKGENHQLGIPNYQITYRHIAADKPVQWIDNQGNSGEIPRNSFHEQDYYPLFGNVGESITFTGTKLPDNQVKNEMGQWVWSPLGQGYVDNYSSEYADQYANEIDISNAIDNQGNPVSLFGIDFIRIYSASLVYNEVIGESSTEIRGIADLRMYKSKISAD